MNAQVVFYALSKKFLEREEDVPPEAKQVMYYSLAIGHHIGVIDCLKTVLSCPLEGFKQWLTRFPEGEARRKLEGILKFGEIAIDITHVDMLARALAEVATVLNTEETAWAEQLNKALESIRAEPAMYLMVRRRDA